MVTKCAQNEMELRTKIDELNGKVFNFESILRKNKEELYIVNTENTNLKTDLKNLSNMETALRNEITNLLRKREELENILQKVKDKLSQDALEFRKSEMEKETLKRQIMSMENTITIASKQVEDLKNETQKLKQMLMAKDKENIILLGSIDQKEIQIQTLNDSLAHAESLLETYK